MVDQTKMRQGAKDLFPLGFRIKIRQRKQKAEQRRYVNNTKFQNYILTSSITNAPIKIRRPDILIFLVIKGVASFLHFDGIPALVPSALQ